MAQHRAPSVKTLTTQLKDVDTAKARLIRRIMRAERRDELHQGARDLHQCRLDRINEGLGRLRQHLLDKALGTFGVEYCYKTSEGVSSHPEDQHGSGFIGKYLNAGDSYAPTLINTGKGWRVGCRADIVERHI